jgi:hypothetical protein
MPQQGFYQELFYMLEETFETHHGVYLDKGTSLFVTYVLARIRRKEE